jgi:hypothetical protein
MNAPLRFLLYILILGPLVSHAQRPERLPFTKGVYGDPGALLRNGESFRSLGINSIFVRSTSLDDELYHAARKERVRVYVEFPTLNGADYLEDHPEAWPVNDKGERAAPADWFMGVCLTDSGFRKHREAQLRTLLTKYSVDGVWLDYLHWHAQFETPEPILPETCFCERCLNIFQEAKGVELPSGDAAAKAEWIFSNLDSVWRQWRSEVLSQWVTNMKSIVREVRPGALLGIYYCPWYPEDFDGALFRILGLDLMGLARIVDVLSPMLYHRMMERSSDWVGEYVHWLGSVLIAERRRTRIWPIVQAHNKPGVITTEEFRRVMWNGSRAPASGIMMFTFNTLVDEPAKLEVMKDLYRKR